MQSRFFYWGIDLATKAEGDSTVITILEGLEHPNIQYQYITRVIKEIRGVDLQEQWEYIKFLAKAFPPTKMKIDNGGLGMQISQMAEKEFPMVAEGINFTMSIKDAIISNFRGFLEVARNTGYKKIVLPNDPALIKETLSLEREIANVGDKPKYHHPDAPGEHDDYIWSMALACWGAKESEGKHLVFGNLLAVPNIKEEIEQEQQNLKGLSFMKK